MLLRLLPVLVGQADAHCRASLGFRGLDFMADDGAAAARAEKSTECIARSAQLPQ